MSSAKTEKNCSKPHILQVSKDQDNEKSSNKPCIDFQPDDRWQIKEDGEEEENSGNPVVRRSTRKRKHTSRLLDNEKDSTVTVNGESVKSDSNLEIEKEFKNGPVTKKTKTSSIPDSKLHDANKTINNAMDADSSDTCEKSNKEPAKANSPKNSVDEQLSAPVLEDERSKNEGKNNGLSRKVVNNSEKSMPELTPNMSESKSKKEDADISIIEEKVSGEESDNDDIQIIDSSQIETKEKRNAMAEAKLFQEPLDNNVLLSSGFPYFDSLRKKIEFYPGQYKPVKFPHIGTLVLEENEVIIESPSLLVPLLIKEADKFPGPCDENGEDSNNECSVSSKPKATSGLNFFQSTVGQFMMSLGFSRVLEWYHKDMKKSKHKQLRKACSNESEIEKAIAWHGSRLKAIKESNVSFNFRMRKCDFCDFRSESQIVMEGHYLTPHLTPRREYRCNFCKYICRDLKDMTFHFEAIHNKRLVTEDQALIHECLFCSFSSNLKSKVNVHMNRCRKNFLPSQYQGLLDFEFPGITTKPVTIADVIAHRRMLMGSSKGHHNSGHPSDSVSAMARKKLASVLSITGTDSLPDSPTLIKHLMGSKQAGGFQLPPGLVLTRPRIRAQSVRPGGTNLQPQLPGLRPRLAATFPSGLPSAATHLASSGISITPINKDGSSGRMYAGKNITLTPISSTGNQVVSQKPGPPQPVALFTNVAGNDKTRPGLLPGSQSSRMPLAPGGGRNPRLMPPYQRLNTPPSQVVKNSSGNTFVLCEICDSYIKDLEELRSHMNWVHKVKIHPKMLVSRPPLNCQKCQWRFFTDQGLERHLLGAHGLVTTNMQEMANKNQDGGRCIICGAVFTYKLVSHMTQVHKVTLKPAHLSYKCTVCTATFTLYRLFESHVYNVHSASAKRPAEESVNEPPVKKATSVELKKDVKKDITKAASDSGSDETPNEPIKCHHCSITTDDLLQHLKEKHIKECYVKLCRIEKCEKCLYSSGDMLIMHLSDFENDDSGSDESSDESDSGDNNESQ